MMPKSKRKEKFVFLKHILEETGSESDKDYDANKDSKEIAPNSAKVAEQQSAKRERERSCPTGKYPVFFSKTCKDKSCQTKSSSFPLFPLPEEIEWISDAEADKKKSSVGLKIKRKQRKSEKKPSKNSNVHDHDEAERVVSKLKNSEGTRKDFKSEHQLKETDNPILQAWLHKKAILARKQRKRERKERRAKRAALEEEARLKAERELESSEKVGQWLKRKRKEARISWGKNRTRVGPHRVETVNSLGRSTPQLTPEYRVVSSFQCTDSSPVEGKGLEYVTNKNNTLNLKNTNKAPIAASSEATSNLDTQETGDRKQKSFVKKLSEDKVSFVESLKSRPNITVNDTETMLYRRPKTAAVKRPKTEKEKSSRSDATAKPGNVSDKKMHSLSYNEWLRVKREEDKDRIIEKKRELIDSHLEAVIKELGKKRVEKIMSPRKKVDTGLKGFVRSSEPSQSPGPKVKKGNMYRWVTIRPEPQGCDNPEIQKNERMLACNQQLTRVSRNAKDVNLEEQVQSNSNQDNKPEALFCEEVDAKCNELKPSIEKVKDVLDAEIKKLRESGRHSKQARDKPDQETVELLRTKPTSSRPMSARPPTERPITDQPASVASPGSAYTTEEQSERIAADLDILGLCGVIAETGDVNVKCNQTSTVRENYFDYGSEVDSPIRTTPDFVQ